MGRRRRGRRRHQHRRHRRPPRHRRSLGARVADAAHVDVRFPLGSGLRGGTLVAVLDPDRCYARAADPRPPLRRLVRHGCAHHRHLLPAELPGRHSRSATTSSSSHRRGGPAGRLPGVQALPARRLARLAGVGRPRRRRRPGHAADRRRGRRPRRRRAAWPAASATASASSSG